MNSRKLIAGFASAAMALTLTACSSGSNSGGNKGGSSSASDSTLIVGTDQELAGVFSPLYYQSAYDGWVVNLVYNSMLKYTADSVLTNDLATEVPTVEDEGKTITFKLKEGVKFSDGSDFTADDVKFTFTLLSDPAYDGRFGINAEMIEGYEDYHDGDAKELTGIEVVDDHTVTFHLSKARIDALATIGGQGIVSDEQFDYTKGDLGGYKENNSEPIGTGAYILNSYEKSTGASFVKNENYSVDDGAYKIERVVIKTIGPNTQLTSIETGDINYIPENIDADVIGPASLNEDLAFNHYFRAAEGYVGFNTTKGATKDEAVRQALAYSINREDFVENYFKYPEASDELKDIPLGYVPTAYWNPVSKDLGAYVTGAETLDGLTLYNFDTDKAKKILDDAGWVEGSDGIREKDGEKLEIKWLASKDNSVLYTLIPMVKKSWKEIGVDLKVSEVDFNTLLSTVDPTSGQDGDWNVFFMATSYTGVENTDALSNLKGGAPDNYSQIDNKDLNKDLNAGLDTASAEDSVENFKKALTLENELVPYLPIYGNELFNIYTNKLQGMETGPVRNWAQALDTAYIE